MSTEPWDGVTERRSRGSRALRWLGDTHRNASILALGAMGTGALLFTQGVQQDVNSVGAMPSVVAGTILLVSGLPVLIFNRRHQALAVGGLILMAFVIGILVLHFTMAAYHGRSSGLALPVVTAYLAVCCTTAADLASEWGKRIEREKRTTRTE